ncbi:MAG: sugar ABC transporter ATP-binding protein [Synergistales bacterium]|nr:sugar ABC transporter ATP-binding protein [Synergistales bacterium]
MQEGEVHALVGENGAGKSTLIKILSGVHAPDEGELRFMGEHISWHAPREAQNAGIAVIHQELSLAPHLSVAENIFLGHEPTRGPFLQRKAMRAEAKRILESLHTSIDVERQVATLTTGEQQLVEIAKSLARDVRVLAMDEPTSSLSTGETEVLFRLIEDLRDHGVGVIYISHRLEEVFRVADTVSILRDGAFVGGGPLREFDRKRIVRLMVGRNVDTIFPREAPPPGPVALKVSGLSREGALHDVSFQVRTGEILGLSGLVGSGRSETARCLFGLDPFQEGRISVQGRQVAIRKPADALHHGLVLIPEDRKRQGLFLNRAVDTNITLLQLIERRFGGFFINRSAQRQEAEQLADRLNVRYADLSQEISSLSGGNQQKVVIAKGLSVTPTILILDEPTRGIDIGAKAEIHELMNRLTHRGMAIIMISSELPEILGMSDRIVVMRQGTVAGEFAGEETAGESVMWVAAGGETNAGD